MHFFWLCVHLVCAIIFVGYVFFDVCVYPLALKKLDKERCESVKKAYMRGSVFIFAGIFLGLLLSGVMLARFYELSLDTLFGWFLLLKLGVLALMFLLGAYSVFFVAVLKKPDPFKGKSHIIALVLCLIIVVLAKAMTYF
ncbi:hypothetical protein [Helicobacter pametensis]|uniref:hypothetical protein n=1 Tax=Helicobacter pametensis TaxID=95149 RepID=UPI00048184FF|nr:hypothetical protein [Helicobacter pametensis]